MNAYNYIFPDVCDDEKCGCPCYEFCKDKMLGVDHFNCCEVYEMFLHEQSKDTKGR